MSVLELDVRDAIEAGVRWWMGELSSLVPGTNRRSAGDGRPDMVVEIEGDELVVVTDGQRTEAAAAIEARSTRGRRPMTRLRLSPSQVLYRETVVPERARRDIPRIAALAAERAMPLPPSEIVADYVVEPDGAGAYRLRQVMARRAKIEDAMARIHALGADVDAVDGTTATGEVLEVDLTPGRAEALRAVDGRRRNQITMLSTIVAGLAVSALWITAVRHEDAAAELAAAIADAKRRLAAAANPSDAADAKAEALRAFAAIKAERPEAVMILAELTRRLPDSAWLTDLKIAETSVDIGGYGKPAAALAPLLEQSPMFRDAALTAPVALDETWGKERFNIRLALTTPPVAGASTATGSEDDAVKAGDPAPLPTPEAVP
ncbi:MAG: PilN domain-containing protein [Hyphomicrobium sp.]|nr:PilN domain-containing protein [Hyphomicrobium sp.]